MPHITKVGHIYYVGIYQKKNTRIIPSLNRLENMKKNDKEKFLKCSKLEDIPPNIKESLVGKGRLKIIEKNTVCVEIKLDDTFPKGDITLEEKQMIENLLERLYIDLEYDRYVIFSMKELISLMTAIIREGCNSHMIN